jgi:hypothetical protein
MKCTSLLVIFGLTSVLAPSASAQGLWVNPDGPRSELPPKTKRERDLSLEGRPAGQVEQLAPDDDMLSDVPDENLDDERLPPTPPVSPSRL